MSLYTKYRPQSFSSLVGQNLVKETLLNEIKNNSLTHAYLFCGPRGTGKTSSARLITKALNCGNKNAEGEPCDSCELCVAIREGSLIDVLEIDAASNRGIDEIRDLKEKIGYAPTQAKNKVYIIDEVHMLTKEAFNALLKTLEEPPSNVFFILCTTEVHKIPETIISRCQRFDFKRINAQDIVERLKTIAESEKIAIEDGALELIAHHVEGGMRDAIGLLEQLTIDQKLTVQHIKTHLSITGHVTIQKLIEAIQNKDAAHAITVINEVHGEGYDLNSFIRELLEHCRAKMIENVQKNGETDSWLRIIMELEKAREMQKTTLIAQLPLEIAVVRLCSNQPVVTVVQSVAAPDAAAKPAAPSTPKTIPSSPAKSFAPLPPLGGFSKPAAEPTSNAEEMNTAQAITTEMVKLDGTIAQHWERIIEHVSPPSLRRSLMQCSLVEKDEALQLVFRAKFHMEKVNTPVIRGTLEKTIFQYFSRKLSIKCELVIAPMSSEERMPQPLDTPAVKEPIAKTPDANASLSDKAMEMFNEW